MHFHCNKIPAILSQTEATDFSAISGAWLTRRVRRGRDLGSNNGRAGDHQRGPGRCKYAALVMVAALLLASVAKPVSDDQANAHRAEIRLGVRLFNEERFSSPKGDLVSSCSHCHLYEADPERARVFTDSFARSWIPWRPTDPRREGARNAPTLFDLADHAPLHFDGEFNSLEELVTGTISGRTFGWLPGEERDALEQIYQVIRKDAGNNQGVDSTYRHQFKLAYGVDLATLSHAQVIELIGRAMAVYLRTLRSMRTSPYDQFMAMNGLDARPAQGETATTYAQRLRARLAVLEAQKKLRTPAGFGAEAIVGMKIFFLTEGAAAVGNCVSCHAPPLFTDASFHNMGVTQSEYDQVHGEGSFAALKIPDAAQAVRPSINFRLAASPGKPDHADLGYWNFINLANSSLRRAEESDSQLLQRMIASFKTPSLRNLAYSEPYMHNGQFASLQSAMAELTRLSVMARAGRVRAADQGLARINIAAADIPPLLAFLQTLNEDLRRWTPTDGR